MTAVTLTPAPAPVLPVLPLATVEDLPWCTCTVPLDGMRPHYLWCDLRAGADR